MTPQSNAPIELQIDQQIARLTLCNPARHNALGLNEVELFSAKLAEVAGTQDLRMLIIEARGDRTFCAGAALDEIESGRLDGDRFCALARQIRELSLPTLCAINGNLYGGGCEIALSCDFRMGTRSIHARVPAARFGLCYPLEGLTFYVDALGLNAAKRLLVASETLEAEELLRIGFLTHLVADDSFASRVDEMAHHIGKLAPLATKAMKSLCNQQAEHALDSSLAKDLIDECNNSNDLRQGLQAARQKTPPVFSGC